MEWISVKDRLPEDMERVLCVEENENFVFISYYKTQYSTPRWDQNRLISHWMSLPKAPKDN